MPARHALVTGASRGIGRAIAEELAARGHRVVINYHTRQDMAEETARAIQERGGTCSLLAFDVTDVPAATAAVKRLVKEQGTVDIVVHNAGVTRDVLFAAMKHESWDRVIRTALDGWFAVTRPCLHGMLKQDWGRVIAVGSVAGQVGNPGQANYAAAKAGLVGAMRSLSAEVCRRGILVNAVAPGFIDTDMLRALEADRAELEARIPMGRVGRPEEVARVVAFLAGDEISYVSGQVIGVNGGMI